MTRVCHITSAHGCEDVRIFHKECVSLARAGYDVFLVQQGDSYDKDGVHVIGFGEPEPSRIKRMTTGAKRAYNTALFLDCDLYHLHDPELLPYGKKLKRLGKKVVFDSHENVLESIKEKEWIPLPLRSFVCSLYARMQQDACSLFDAIVVVTPSMVDGYAGINKNIEIVANYPIVDDNRSHKYADSRTLVFAGGISQQWNIDLVMQAMSEVPDCKLSICGPADQDYLNRLKLLPEWDRVQYIGKIPHEDVSGFLSQGVIGLAVLSYSNNTAWRLGTMGNTKVFEEMLAGLPVVCTDFVLWKEFVSRYKCGLCVNPGNVYEIREAITWLLANPSASAEMGRNGRKAIMEVFNWKNEAAKLIKLYQALGVF